MIVKKSSLGVQEPVGESGEFAPSINRKSAWICRINGTAAIEDCAAVCSRRFSGGSAL
jgi:hypothetical protein